MPKISIQILPSFKELLNTRKKGSIKLFSQFNYAFFLNRSATSIRIICDAVFYEKKRTINIFIPEYFCGETLGAIRNHEHFNLVFYPITNDFVPDYKECTRIAKTTAPDLFVFVHYFGIKMDVASARNFCNFNNSLLIEDCAHVIYSFEKFGCLGDFSLFSMHKCFPVVDGAALCINDSDRINPALISQIRNEIDKLNRFDAKRSYFRILIKKILLQKPKGTYSYQVHYDSGNANSELYKISKESENILATYSEKEIRKIVYIREHNLRMMNSVIDEYDLPIKPLLFGKGESYPYIGVYRIVEESKADTICKELVNSGFPMGVWTYLPKEIQKQSAVIAEDLSKTLFTVPIHQNIKEERIVKFFTKRKEEARKKCFKVVPFKAGEHEWESLLKKVDFSAITQDYIYGCIKAKIDHKKHCNYLIKENEDVIGFFQSIEKRFLLTKIIRINKGPVLFDNHSNDLTMDAVRTIKNSFKNQLLIISPGIEYSPDNTKSLILEGFHKLEYSNKFTSFVDLTQPKELIRSNLKSKWRNQLKTAEKKIQCFKEIDDDFDSILKLYDEYMKQKKFSGIPVLFLKEMRKKAPWKLKVYGCFINDKLIAFDIVYIHGYSSTYLVGWEDELGREVCANNFLLFNIMLSLKEKGVRIFDLGGLGLISAPSIAKFKMGITGQVFEYCGDYLSFR